MTQKSGLNGSWTRSPSQRCSFPVPARRGKRRELRPRSHAI